MRCRIEGNQGESERIAFYLLTYLHTNIHLIQVIIKVQGGERMAVINIREVPDDLHTRVKVQAAKERTTLRELVIRALEEYLKKVGG
jgi:hypothetical protein